MMIKSLFLGLALAVTSVSASAKDNIDYVDPFIGTTNYSVCNPGAVMPHGLMSVVPFNVMGSDLNAYDKDKRWWSAPYEFTNKFFTGFAHVTLSGVGCPEMGSILVMPTTGEVEADCSKYGSEYEGEQASPGYYAVRLKKYGIGCEVTSTMRSSCERFTFPAGKGNILVNLGDALSNESGAWLHRVSDTEIEGMRNLGTFCYNSGATFPIYFVLRVSRKPVKTGFWKKQPSLGKVKDAWEKYSGRYKFYDHHGSDMAGNEIGYYLTFDCNEGEAIEVQVGVSMVSTANARLNLDAEQPTRDFAAVRHQARQAWAAVLDKVSVEGGSEAQRRTFFTALYHTQIHPNILQDVNGQYPKMESDEVLTTKGNR